MGQPQNNRHGASGYNLGRRPPRTSGQPLLRLLSLHPLSWSGEPRVESLFLRSLAEGDFSVVELMKKDYERMADLVVTYGDLPLGTTDAAVVAIA
jgi:hypothetical protein